MVLTYTTLVIGLQFTMTPLNTWGVNSLDNRVIQHAPGTFQHHEPSGGLLWHGRARVGVGFGASGGADAPAAEQAYLGEHMAYCTTFGLMCVAALVIIFLVRNRPAAAAGTVVATPTERGEEPVDYAAGHLRCDRGWHNGRVVGSSAHLHGGRGDEPRAGVRGPTPPPWPRSFALWTQTRRAGFPW